MPDLTCGARSARHGFGCPIMVRVLPSAQLMELILGQRAGDAVRSHGGDVHGWPPLDDPLGQQLAQRRRGGQAANATPADDPEATHTRSRAQDMLSIGGHRWQPAPMLLKRNVAKDREL